MTDPIQLDTLRQVLARVFPMQGVIVVGVGRGQGLADFRSASSLLLIDARAECIEALQRQSPDGAGSTAVQAVIAAQTGSAAFHVASKPDESGLIAPEALQALWRNLTTRTTEEVEASTLFDLVARLELAADFRCNWLVVDCLPALPVLDGAGQLIDDVEVLELRCVRDEDIAPGQGSSLGSAKDWLEPLGFRLVQEAEESHPQLVKALFCRDLRKLGGRVGLLEQSIAELQASNDENARVHAKEKGALTTERDKLAKENQALAAERERLVKSLKAEAQASAEAQSSRLALQAQVDECLNELQRLKDEAQLGKTIQSLADQLSAQDAGLADQLAKQNAELVRLRKQLLSAVKQEVLNGTQQLEAFLDIQNFFKHGKHLPALHGWPVSPDFARYLIQLLEKNDYDLILEFGSGTSTVIIAKTLAHLDRTRQGKPAALQIAFEHLEKYHDQTSVDLESAGLAQSVELTLAPLQPYQPPNGKTYSYYACHEKLGDVATRLPATPIKILLVVDGPPASTGQHARYPAVPAVLAPLKDKCLDILLDDYARPDEKEVGVLWEQDLEQLGYKLRSEKISMEKEALFISATPQ